MKLVHNLNKAVVIGGAGFLGSHTADELSRRGFDVTIYDIHESPWTTSDQTFVQGDLLSRNKLTEVISGSDIVYHFAGVADIETSKQNPLQTIQTNVMGTALVLDICVELQVKRFVYASTMYVYSQYGSFYRASKQSSETILEAYHQKYDIDYTILRYGSLYGPRAQEWNGLRRFVTNIMKDKSLSLPGGGKEKREFIHVVDAARLSVDILNSIEYINQAITVTGHQVLTLHEVASMIFEICAIDSNIDSGPDKHWDDRYKLTPYRYTPKKAMKLIPDHFVDIGQGILDLVEEVHEDLDK